MYEYYVLKQSGHWIHDWKPAASRRAHLFAASLVWTCAGSGLLFVGVRWELRAEAWLAALLLCVATVAGALKYRFVLHKAARRVADRIRSRGDDRCLGGFFSWRTWILVAFMMTAGRLLRSSPLSKVVIGALYAAIGVALLLAATNLWRAWYRAGTSP